MRQAKATITVAGPDACTIVVKGDPLAVGRIVSRIMEMVSGDGFYAGRESQ